MTPENERQFKNEIFDQFGKIGKALANGRRLELLDLLSQGERTVEDLAGETDMPVASASQHLQILSRVRLVERRRVGTYVYYRLASDKVFRLWQSLRECGEEHLADIDRIVHGYLEHRERFEPVRMNDLYERLKAGQVILLDIRPRQEYELGHIEGARSVPLEELEGILDDIPGGTEVVAYCRGPYCVFADEAVAFLHRNGVPARRMDQGYPDWKTAGLPVARELTKEDE